MFCANCGDDLTTIKRRKNKFFCMNCEEEMHQVRGPEFDRWEEKWDYEEEAFRASEEVSKSKTPTPS